MVRGATALSSGDASVWRCKVLDRCTLIDECLGPLNFLTLTGIPNHYRSGRLWIRASSSAGGYYAPGSELDLELSQHNPIHIHAHLWPEIIMTTASTAVPTH